MLINDGELPNNGECSESSNTNNHSQSRYFVSSSHAAACLLAPSNQLPQTLTQSSFLRAVQQYPSFPLASSGLAASPQFYCGSAPNLSRPQGTLFCQHHHQNSVDSKTRVFISLSSLLPGTSLETLCPRAAAISQDQIQFYKVYKLKDLLCTKEKPSRILPFLFLGDKYNAFDLEYLKSHNIRAILNISRHLDHVHAYNFPEFQCKYIHLSDLPQQEIISYFPSAFEFIEQAKDNGHNVLVHCSLGVSRSPTVVIAYLMKALSLSLSQAFDYVKSKRPIINPNFGFLTQLKAFESRLQSRSFV